MLPDGFGMSGSIGPGGASAPKVTLGATTLKELEGELGKGAAYYYSLYTAQVRPARLHLPSAAGWLAGWDGGAVGGWVGGQQ